VISYFNASISEEHSISIFKAEVTMLGSGGLRETGKSETTNMEKGSGPKGGLQVAEGGGSVESKEKNRPFSELPEGVSILVESLFPFPQVANERLPWPTQEEAILPVNVVGLELNLYRFLNDSIHASRLLGQNTGVVHLDTMAQVNAGFSHSRLLGMVETDVSVMLFNSHLNRTTSFVRCTLFKTRTGCCIRLAFLGPGRSLRVEEKWKVFLVGDHCLHVFG
jgi:hypothetical protein